MKHEDRITRKTGIVRLNCSLFLFLAAGILFSCSHKSVPNLLTMIEVEGGTIMMGNNDGKNVEKPQRFEFRIQGCAKQFG